MLLSIKNITALQAIKLSGIVGSCIIKLNNDYYTNQYLTLTCIRSPVGVITSSESSIIFKAMSAIWTA